MFAQISVQPHDALQNDARSPYLPNHTRGLHGLANRAVVLSHGRLESALGNPGPQIRSLVYALAPLSESDHRPANGKLGPAVVSAPIPGSGKAPVFPANPLAPLPALDGAPVRAAEDSLLHREVQASASAPKPERGAPAQSGAAPAPMPAAPVLASPNPLLSAAEIAELLEHGDAFVHTGDLASARLLYERAAAAGNGRAALRLGATFDPAFLERAGLRSVKGDAAVARSWYSRARDLGAAEAKRQRNSLETNQGR